MASQPGLFAVTRERMRTRHLSLRTEQAYLHTPRTPPARRRLRGSGFGCPLRHHDLSEVIGDRAIRLAELAPGDQLVEQALQLALGDFLGEVRVQHGDEALALARAADLLRSREQLPGLREQRPTVAVCGQARAAAGRSARIALRASMQP